MKFRKFSLGTIAKRVKASNQAAIGIAEPLERRVLLSSFLTSNYFPLGAGQPVSYVGSYSAGYSSTMLANARDTRTTSAATINGAAATGISDTITYSSGGPTASLQTQYFALDGNGLEYFGQNPSVAPAAPIHLLNAVANVGDDLTWSNVPVLGLNVLSNSESGSCAVVGYGAITLRGDTQVNAFEIVFTNTQTLSSYVQHSAGGDVVTTQIFFVEKLWLAAGAGVVEFADSFVSGNVISLEQFTSGNVAADAPTSLAIGQQPNDSKVQVPISPTITVAVLNASGQIDTSDNSVVSLTLPGGNASGALDGTINVQAIDGVANFNDVQLDLPGSYAFNVSDGALTPALSNTILVTTGGISISNGIVTVSGSEGSDTISAGVDPSDSSQYYFKVLSGDQPSVLQLYPQSQVTGLVVNGDPANAAPSMANDDLINLGGENFGFAVSINGGQGSDTIIGQQGPNNIAAQVGHNLVYGGAGNDSIESNGTHDTLRSGGGADTIASRGMGFDLLVGGKDGSELYGSSVTGAFGDTLYGGRGNSTLHGADDALMVGGFGNDLLEDGPGSFNFDTIIAGSGRSTLLGGNNNDFLDAGFDAYLTLAGGNTLPSPTGSDSVDASGAIENETLVANSASPTLKGSSAVNSFDVNDPGATLQNVNAGQDFIAQNDTVASVTQTISIRLTIQVINNGVTTDAIIPQGAGNAPSGISAARTTDASGTIVFQSNGPRTFTLADFFNHWGVDFNSFGVGQFITSAGSGHALSMTVNGVANTGFQNYAVQNGDNIVITFTQ